MFKSELIQAPNAEPLSLSDAKSWLKVETDDDDVLISGIITSARLTIEAVTGLLLLKQIWRFSLAMTEYKRNLTCPYRPLSSLMAARFRSASDQIQDVPISRSIIISKSQAEFYLPLDGGTIFDPSTRLEIDAQMGYGADPALIPSPLTTAIRLLVAYWYENRGETLTETTQPWPTSINVLLHPYQIKRMGS